MCSAGRIACHARARSRGSGRGWRRPLQGGTSRTRARYVNKNKWLSDFPEWNKLESNLNEPDRFVLDSSGSDVSFYFPANWKVLWMKLPQAPPEPSAAFKEVRDASRLLRVMRDH